MRRYRPSVDEIVLSRRLAAFSGRWHEIPAYLPYKKSKPILGASCIGINKAPHDTSILHKS